MTEDAGTQPLATTTYVPARIARAGAVRPLGRITSPPEPSIDSSARTMRAASGNRTLMNFKLVRERRQDAAPIEPLLDRTFGFDRPR